MGVDRGGAQKDRGWIESSPDVGYLVFRPGTNFATQRLFPAVDTLTMPEACEFLWSGFGKSRPLHLSLDVVVQRELVRMGPRIDSLDLVLHLVADPSFDQVFAEHVSLEEEVMVLLQGDQGFFKRTGERG